MGVQLIVCPPTTTQLFFELARALFRVPNTRPLAVMMGNAGGAWDNAKKLCEKLDLKKTDQGKACVVGDTVGDPFKDTSGPSLDILLKLMSMVALLIAPLIEGKDDYEDFYLGLIPLFLGVVATGLLIFFGILTWKDPLMKTLNAESNGEKGDTKIISLKGEQAWGE